MLYGVLRARGSWAVVSGCKFLTFRLLCGGHLQKQFLKQPPLKMPATDAGETSGIYSLRSRPTSLEDTLHVDAGRESLNQYTSTSIRITKQEFYEKWSCPLNLPYRTKVFAQSLNGEVNKGMIRI